MSDRRNYMCRAEQLYQECAKNYTLHPFSESLINGLNSGGVHPLVLGTFRETDNNMEQTTKKCVKYATSWIENSNVT